MNPKGNMTVVRDGMPHDSRFMLLGSEDEGGQLKLLDVAGSYEEAQSKAAQYLLQNPEGGVLITKHKAACFMRGLPPLIAH